MFRALVLVALVSMGLVGCSQSQEVPSGTRADEIVARVNQLNETLSTEYQLYLATKSSVEILMARSRLNKEAVESMDMERLQGARPLVAEFKKLVSELVLILKSGTVIYKGDSTEVYHAEIEAEDVLKRIDARAAQIQLSEQGMSENESEANLPGVSGI